MRNLEQLITEAKACQTKADGYNWVSQLKPGECEIFINCLWAMIRGVRTWWDEYVLPGLTDTQKEIMFDLENNEHILYCVENIMELGDH